MEDMGKGNCLTSTVNTGSWLFPRVRVNVHALTVSIIKLSINSKKSLYFIIFCVPNMMNLVLTFMLSDIQRKQSYCMMV